MNKLRKMIDLRKRGSECHEDFLQGLVRDESHGNEPLTDDQILDNILTLIIAGVLETLPKFHGEQMCIRKMREFPN